MIEKVIFGLFIIGCLTFIYALFEPYWIKKQYYEVRGAPESFKGKKIVFLSDIHNSYISPIRNLSDIVNMVNDLSPDIIILGGDYVSGNKKYVPPCFKQLSKLKSVYGVYGVLGNHDYEAGDQLVKDCMNKAKVKVLDNEYDRISINNESIRICGVSDFIFGKPDLEIVRTNEKNHEYTILVSHNPDIVGKIQTKSFDLVLSGHTHGGQITVFGLYAPNIPSKHGQTFRTGLVETKYTKLIVSNGIGCIGLPLRFFARPQIVVVQLT